MEADRVVGAFQELIDQVVRTGERREVAADALPGVRTWNHLDSKGCVIWVEKGRWWVLPPGGSSERPAA